MRAARFTLIALALAVGGGLLLTRPAPLPTGYASGHVPDAVAGARIFDAGGCASCHTKPNAEATELPALSGGKAFPSDFGTFHAPNISPHPTAGIGNWTQDEFARAVTLGVSPEGQHYYPAFPYGAYQHMKPGDVANLFAYIQSLPASDVPNIPHDVGFPFNIRRGLGLWKLAFVHDNYVMAEAETPVLERGRYLAEGLAHCGECHTPRNAVGGLNTSRWMAGTPNPSGKGTIPNITPAKLEWSEADLIEYFTTGFTPDYDSAGGEMVEVIENLSKLPAEDRAAIAAYVLALTPVP